MLDCSLPSVALILKEHPSSVCEWMHSNDMVAATSKLFPIFCHWPGLQILQGCLVNIIMPKTLTWKYPRRRSPSPEHQIQSQHLPPKSGLKRMSYPFSNLSTVVLATDIPVLPVEELRTETTSHFWSSKHRTGCLMLLSQTFCVSTAHLQYYEEQKWLRHVLHVRSINDKNGTLEEKALTSLWRGGIRMH